MPEISYTNAKYVTKDSLLSKSLNFSQKSLISILRIHKHHYIEEKCLVHIHIYIKSPAHVLLFKLFILFFKLCLIFIYNLSVMTDLLDF